jgi:hypothetical protein
MSDYCAHDPRYPPKKDPRKTGKRDIRGEPARVKEVHDPFAGEYFEVFKGSLRGRLVVQ